jgi:hypothetical protein
MARDDQTGEGRQPGPPGQPMTGNIKRGQVASVSGHHKTSGRTREPDAGNLHVRFDERECGNGAAVEPRGPRRRPPAGIGHGY